MLDHEESLSFFDQLISLPQQQPLQEQQPQKQSPLQQSLLNKQPLPDQQQRSFFSIQNANLNPLQSKQPDRNLFKYFTI